MVYLCAVCGKCLSMHMWKLLSVNQFLWIEATERKCAWLLKKQQYCLYRWYSLYFYYQHIFQLILRHIHSRLYILPPPPLPPIASSRQSNQSIHEVWKKKNTRPRSKYAIQYFMVVVVIVDLYGTRSAYVYVWVCVNAQKTMCNCMCDS